MGWWYHEALGGLQGYGLQVSEGEQNMQGEGLKDGLTQPVIRANLTLLRNATTQSHTLIGNPDGS